MSIEMSRKIKALEARVKALEAAQPAPGWLDRINDMALQERIAAPQVPNVSAHPNDGGSVVSGPHGEQSPATRLKAETPAVAATKHKLCPKCLKAPAYYFHVKYCEGPEKQKDDDRLGTNNAT
jgi:hypothetical protein